MRGLLRKSGTHDTVDDPETEQAVGVRESAPVQADAAAISTMGKICLGGGLIGAASGASLAIVPAQVEETVYSYPLDAWAFTAIQTFFFVQHLALVIGLVGLWRSRAAGGGRTGTWGLAGAIAGMTLLALVELAAITAANSPYPSSRTDVLDAFYGISSMLIGAGLVMAGIAVVRAHVWTGWQRFVPLVLGGYVFVPMIPAIFGPFVLARLAITAWMLLFALLGWLLLRDPGRNDDRTDTHRSPSS